MASVPRRSQSIGITDQKLETKREGVESPRKSKSANESSGYAQVLVRTKNMDYKFPIYFQKNKGNFKHVLKILKEENPQFSGISFKPVKGADQELLKMELQLMVRGYKFGILYATKGQTQETEWFQNREVGKDFQEFLDFVGSKIRLKGWPGYNGGLDVEADSTGTHSIYSKYLAYEVMFHVSTLLPYTEDEDQQLARKRHLGNDIVIILFMESDCDLVFDPTMIRSYFNHVYFVIKKENRSTPKTAYRISIVSKNGVDEFTPGLPDPPIIEKDESGKEWLFSKLINAERASYSAPGFANAIERTREALMKEIFDTYYTTASWAGWT